MSTLGSRAIEILLRSDYLEGWDHQSLSDLQHLAALRSAGEAQVHALFPELFEGLEQDDKAAALHALQAYGSILSPQALSQGVAYLPGTLPCFITAPHGGSKKQLNGYELPFNPIAQVRDGATAEIACDIRAATNDRLPVVIDSVHRQYRTLETRAYFETQTFLRIAGIRRNLDAHCPLLHLDLHGFRPAPETNRYDLILGTGHRSTMKGLAADKELADYLHKRGYSVYFPDETPRVGELYSATHKSTLVQRVASLALKNTASIQIEINATFRTQERKHHGERLAQDIGLFCMDWASLV